MAEVELQVVEVPVLPNGPGKRLEYKLNLWSEWAKQHYGSKVFKVGVSLNSACPNRAEGGCIFCLQDTFTPEYKHQSTTEQLNTSIDRIKRGVRRDLKFIAYFQDETMGAVATEKLESAFKEAIQHPEIVGLIVSTRPDYCSDEFLDVVSRYNAFLELGMQTIHNESLTLLNRNHSHNDTVDALKRIENKGIMAGVHLIVGIPNESINDILETIRYVNSKPVITDVKLHNLVAFKGTKLAISNYTLPNINEYIQILIKIIPYLVENKTISRLFTSNLSQSQIALNIQGEKKLWLNQLLQEIYTKNILQGLQSSIVNISRANL